MFLNRFTCALVVRYLVLTFRKLFLKFPCPMFCIRSWLILRVSFFNFHFDANQIADRFDVSVYYKGLLYSRRAVAANKYLRFYRSLLLFILINQLTALRMYQR